MTELKAGRKATNFTPLPNEILLSCELSDGEFKMYCLLLYEARKSIALKHEDEDDRPLISKSYSDLAKETGISESSVKRYVSGLIKKGFVKVKSLPGEKNEYLLFVPKSFVQDTPVKSDTQFNSDLGTQVKSELPPRSNLTWVTPDNPSDINGCETPNKYSKNLNKSTVQYIDNFTGDEYQIYGQFGNIYLTAEDFSEIQAFCGTDVNEAIDVTSSIKADPKMSWDFHTDKDKVMKFYREDKANGKYDRIEEKKKKTTSGINANNKL